MPTHSFDDLMKDLDEEALEAATAPDAPMPTMTDMMTDPETIPDMEPEAEEPEPKRRGKKAKIVEDDGEPEAEVHLSESTLAEMAAGTAAVAAAKEYNKVVAAADAADAAATAKANGS